VEFLISRLGGNIEEIEAKALRKFSKVYSLFRSGQLSTNVKVPHHKALTRFIMTHAYPSWKVVADISLLKLQHLQNGVLCTVGKFPNHTPNRKLHVAFNVSYVNDFITKLCR
jgi:hypothetical protein